MASANDDMRDQLLMLKAANRIALLLSKAQRVEDAVEQLMAEFVELAQADEGSIQLLRPTSPMSRRTLIRRAGARNGWLDSRLDDLLTGWVVKHKQALLTNDLASTLDLGKTAERYAEIRSVLAVPLIVQEQVIGVVNLIRAPATAPFSMADQRLVDLLAREIAGFIEQAHIREQLFNDYERLRQEIPERFGIHGIIGHGGAMKEVFSVLDRIIPTDGRVLIHGESGTGKELIAKVIHYAGPRQAAPFVAVDCGALPSNLLESELFGYVRGAFTSANRDRRGLFEEADTGTLFLDEIVNMPMELQAKLLRAIQESEIRPLGNSQVRKVDVRIIAAASESVRDEMIAGKFRRDLFYRLNVVNINLPSLRERKEDIPILADHFLGTLNRKYGKHIKGFHPDTMTHLAAYAWPGNIRELEHAMERAVVLCQSDRLDQADFPLFETPHAEGDTLFQPRPWDEAIFELKRQYLANVLKHTGGAKKQAAEILQIQPTYLSRLLKNLQIDE
ncbi:sigma-54-dependent Fis family transcriptional regulator [candidate division KSB1 bacterium]|nr:sigma-54-dependent Fis family transcriptional regulator [candidate division KSB1 bacterium]